MSIGDKDNKPVRLVKRAAADVAQLAKRASARVERLGKRAVEKPMRWYNRQPRRTRIVAAGLAGALTLGIMVPTLWLTFNPLPSISMLEHYTPVEAIKIYDIHDKLAAVVSGEEDRLSVKLNDVSPNMRKAMLAAEDHEFYSHGGFDLSSIARAAIKNVQAGRVVEGASTITQQLVKNLFFPGEERTFNRKIKEVILATQVDAKYSKDQILEMYLNQIYFGNQSYGIERAAQRYFNKPASKLSLAESAFLAGVVKAPSYLSHPSRRQEATARQHEVLDKLVEYKMANADEVAKAKQEKLAFRKFVSPYQKYPFYVAAVMDQLRQKYGEEELQRGLKVYTNLDPEAQLAGERALAKGIEKAPRGVEQGALASVRIEDGAVLALVGGVGQYEKNQWNRATSPHTMGSSFKPFVYMAGFLKGKNPEDVVVDAPVSFPSGGQYWSPRNFEGGFMGAMTIKKALAYSRNVCAAKVAHEVGIQNVIKVARQAGLTSRMEPYLPISLGASASSPLEMASAYATFARGGIRINPMVIRKIENNDGTVLASYSPQPEKVFDSQATSKLLVALQEVVTNGTGVLARLPGRPMAGKTGTSDAARDIWFVGFTADTATACWGGNDFNKAIHNTHVTGGMIMSKIWKDYMTEYYEKHPTPALAFFTPAKDAPKIAIEGDSGAAVASTPDADLKKKQDEAKAKIAQAAALKEAKKKQAKRSQPVVDQTIERAAVVKPEEATSQAAPAADAKAEEAKPGEEPAPTAHETPKAEPAAEPAAALPETKPAPAATASVPEPKPAPDPIAPKPAPAPAKAEAPNTTPSPAAQPVSPSSSLDTAQ
jgi:penicillin-binding protein 1A